MEKNQILKKWSRIKYSDWRQTKWDRQKDIGEEKMRKERWNEKGNWICEGKEKTNYGLW